MPRLSALEPLFTSPDARSVAVSVLRALSLARFATRSSLMAFGGPLGHELPERGDVELHLRLRRAVEQLQGPRLRGVFRRHHREQTPLDVAPPRLLLAILLGRPRQRQLLHDAEPRGPEMGLPRPILLATTPGRVVRPLTMPRIPDARVAEVFRKALGGGILVPHSDTAVVFYDMSHIGEQLAGLTASFPPTTLHAVAVKANPLRRILERMASSGFGFEAASLPELSLATRAGAPGNRVVFDSPAKTEAELRCALGLGCHINADSLYELDRISKLLTEERVPTTSTIGIRVNPQVGTGSIASTSVAGKYSKFGVPLTERRDDLLDRFARHEWLTALHLHIGSQGCPMEMLLDGIGQVLNLANDADALLASKNAQRRIRTFDIGGGLPVSYESESKPAPIQDYAAEVRRRFPDLFSGRFRLITEFGRYIHANSGWVASRVEYVKQDRNGKTAIIHVGADLFLRKCYRPNDWHHEIMILDPSGEPKEGTDTDPYVIAGPLCFAGDVLADGLRLPAVNEGDFVIIRDTGAYTLSMWSRYNSRQVPKIVGYTHDGEQFETLRERETVEQTLSFWE